MDLHSTRVCLCYIFKFQEAFLACRKHGIEQMGEETGSLSYEGINNILKHCEGKAKG